MINTEFNAGQVSALRRAADSAEDRAKRRDMLGLTEAAEALRDFADSLRAAADALDGMAVAK
jgi:acyl-CoA reductase-like NAD-dependent aldehyde dehydrogenase